MVLALQAVLELEAALVARVALAVVLELEAALVARVALAAVAVVVLALEPVLVVYLLEAVLAVVQVLALQAALVVLAWEAALVLHPHTYPGFFVVPSLHPVLDIANHLDHSPFPPVVQLLGLFDCLSHRFQHVRQL